MNANLKELIKTYFKLLLFFSFSFVKSNIQKKDLILNNHNIQKMDFQNDNINYKEYIIFGKETLTIKLNINGDNFEYLTYEVIPNYGEIKVCISYDNKTGCEAKPNENNIKILESYKSFFYTYNKNEEKENEKDIYMIIECREGIYNGTNFICVGKYINYTENNIINMNDSNIKDLPLFKYISKNNINNYLFQLENNLLYLNIETLSGNIKLKYFNENCKLFSEYDNKKQLLYCKINSSIHSNNLAVNISAFEDSFYSIYDYTNMFIRNNFFIVGSNFYLKIENSIKNSLLLDYYYYYEQNTILYYLGIYSPDKNIVVTQQEAWSQNKIDINPIDGFYQIILSSDLDYDFIIINKNEITEKVNPGKDYVLCYKLDNITGISLTNGIKQPFILNKNFNNLTFSYPHTQKEKDININLEIKEIDTYLIKICFNNIINEKYSYNFDNTNKININLSSTFIKTNCFKTVQICKILIYIKSENLTDNCLLYITVNTINKKGEKEEYEINTDNTNTTDNNNILNITNNTDSINTTDNTITTDSNNSTDSSNIIDNTNTTDSSNIIDNTNTTDSSNTTDNNNILNITNNTDSTNTTDNTITTDSNNSTDSSNIIDNTNTTDSSNKTDNTNTTDSTNSTNNTTNNTNKANNSNLTDNNNNIINNTNNTKANGKDEKGNDYKYIENIIILVILFIFLAGLLIMIIFVIINIVDLINNKDLYKKIEYTFGKELKSNIIIDEEDDKYKII